MFEKLNVHYMSMQTTRIHMHYIAENTIKTKSTSRKTICLYVHAI